MIKIIFQLKLKKNQQLLKDNNSQVLVWQKYRI